MHCHLASIGPIQSMFLVTLKDDETDGNENKDKHVYLESIHWTKTELLGTGAFSSCYAARDKGSGTLMAVKQVLILLNTDDIVVCFLRFSGVLLKMSVRNWISFFVVPGFVLSQLFG